MCVIAGLVNGATTLVQMERATAATARRIRILTALAMTLSRTASRALEAELQLPAQRTVRAVRQAVMPVAEPTSAASTNTSATPQTVTRTL